MIDQGQPISPDTAPRIVCAAVIHVLSSLPSPLVPLIHQAICLKARDRDEAFASIEALSQVNTNVCRVLTMCDVS